MIVFDVGANNGSSTIGYALNGETVYAFEPVPEMCEILKKCKKPNYHVIQKAVSDYNGKSVFYVTAQSDWGSSSLYPYSDNVWEIWAGREKDMTVSYKIEVDVITMEKFIDDNNITSVDYLHCDAQGSDLKVLQSFGKHINLLKEGVVEAADRQETSTYKTDNTVASIRKFLESNGFKITKIEPNDCGVKEVNLYFKK
jgi:FkbM family methyltransferase